MARKQQQAQQSLMSEALTLPFLWSGLYSASLETMARRSLLFATGNFTLGEYQRMMCEKAAALQGTTVAAMSPAPTPEALMAPWHRIARANALRLRRAQG